jgi:hypothetical protein
VESVKSVIRHPHKVRLSHPSLASVTLRDWEGGGKAEAEVPKFMRMEITDFTDFTNA